MTNAKGYPLAKLALFFLGFTAFSSTHLVGQSTIEAVEFGSANDNVHAWSDPDAWVGGVVPGAGDHVLIENSIIVLDTDVSVASVTLTPFGYFYLYDVNDEAALSTDGGSTQYAGTGNGHTLTITDYVNLTTFGWMSGDDATKGSTLILNTNSASSSGEATIRGTYDLNAWNVVVPTDAVVDFNSGSTSENVAYLTVLNELAMTGGSVTTNAPVYGSASTLSYEAETGTVGDEWTHTATSGAGVPQDVMVQSGATLSMGATSNSYALRGNLYVENGELDLSTMDGNLSVEGNSIVGSAAASTLKFTSTEGKGDLLVDGNLTIGGSGTISGSQGDVEIGGNFANNGPAASFNSLKLNGDVAQVVSGSALTTDALVVDNSEDDTTTGDSDVTFNATVDITPGGTFDPMDGSVDINATFTMNSDATGTARIATLANAAATSDVSGDITFERYVPAVTDGVSWLAVGNYVNGATRADWTSSFGTDYHLVLDWDETATLPTFANEAAASPWQPVTNASDALHNDGEGYLVFTVANSSPTLSATGTYNSSQQDLVGLTVSNGANQGGGWHLVSNPFPSAISGTEFLADNASLISRYYMYDNDADVFKTDITGAPTTIDIGQSFWIQVSSAGTVSFEIDQAVASSNSFLRSVDPFDAGMAALRIEQPDGKFGNTFIRFHENATHEWEWELDATHRNSANGWTPELYTQLENNHKLAINSIPAIMEASTVMSFVVETGSSGSVEISAESGYSMPDGTCAFIEDSETGEVMPFTSGESMELDLEPFETYADRFFIHFMNSPEFEATSSYCEGGVVHFVGEDSGLWNIEWSSLDGAMNGEGCVTGLETGHYVFSGENELTHCYTETELEISSVCMGDFNLNGERDITDLLILLVGIQPVENFEGTFPSTDCDCDGAMTTLDLLMFLPQFGNVCAD
jgi:hypothetical protein